MALGAVQVAVVFGSRVGVVIRQVAGHALGVESLVSPGLVTFHTIQSAMGSAQREAGEGVFKAAEFPHLLRMAFFAVRQSPAVHIIFLMAGVTLLAHPGQLPAVFMTLRARQIVVHSREGEVFVEVAHDLPVLLRMALLAARSEVSAVRVFMAVHALV